MNTLIDTHCHITCDALYERIDEVLENARQAGIEKMLIICTDFTEYERAQQLKEREPERFDIALGFHPNDLYAFQEADYERLEELLKQEPSKAFTFGPDVIQPERNESTTSLMTASSI